MGSFKIYPADIFLSAEYTENKKISEPQIKQIYMINVISAFLRMQEHIVGRMQYAPTDG